jgi:deleted-in-malignant-brain-tumors protein 1
LVETFAQIRLICCSISSGISYDIFVLAYSDLQIKLVNPKNNKTGRVEIYHPSFGWGTVCGWKRWTKVEGEVVCRQLNFTGANAVMQNSYPYGEGSGPILLDIIKCTGNESYIWDCSHRGWNVHYLCKHNEDVGVDC